MILAIQVFRSFITSFFFFSHTFWLRSILIHHFYTSSTLFAPFPLNSFTMLAPKTFVSLLAAASAAFALPGSVMPGAEAKHGLEARQDAVGGPLLICDLFNPKLTFGL